MHWGVSTYVLCMSSSWHLNNKERNFLIVKTDLNLLRYFLLFFVIMDHWQPFWLLLPAYLLENLLPRLNFTNCTYHTVCTYIAFFLTIIWINMNVQSKNSHFCSPKTHIGFPTTWILFISDKWVISGRNKTNLIVLCKVHFILW